MILGTFSWTTLESLTQRLNKTRDPVVLSPAGNKSVGLRNHAHRMAQLVAVHVPDHEELRLWAATGERAPAARTGQISRHSGLMRRGARETRPAGRVRAAERLRTGQSRAIRSTENPPSSMKYLSAARTRKSRSDITGAQSSRIAAVTPVSSRCAEKASANRWKAAR